MPSLKSSACPSERLRTSTSLILTNGQFSSKRIFDKYGEHPQRVSNYCEPLVFNVARHLPALKQKHLHKGGVFD